MCVLFANHHLRKIERRLKRYRNRHCYGSIIRIPATMQHFDFDAQDAYVCVRSGLDNVQARFQKKKEAIMIIDKDITVRNKWPDPKEGGGEDG